MSKAARNRESNAEKQRIKREREEFALKMSRVRKITAIVTSSVIALILAILLIGYAIGNARLNSGAYLRGKVAASSATQEVSGTMMTYFYNDVYNTFVDHYGSYVSYYGLNPAISAKAQFISDDQTWFEYFMSGARGNIESLLALGEAAKASGFTLSEAELAAVNARVDGMDVGLYGRGVNRGDILDAKLLEALAYRYRFAKERELYPTDSEIAGRYAQNTNRYRRVNCLVYVIDYSSGAFSAEEAEQAAARLAAAKDSEAFTAVMRELILKQYPAMTDKELDEELELYRLNGALYTEGDEFSEWAFNGARVGDTHIVKDDGRSRQTVYMLTSEPERDESRTVTVRHILVKPDPDTASALAKANAILARFNAGDRSEESFALLALECSDDTGTYYNGGLRENITGGRLQKAFDDWCFSPRNAGDTGIVETDSGIHIVYFVGSGPESWAADAASDIVSDRFAELNAELLKAYPAEFDPTVLDRIPG